jgi:hypothetical protein
MVMYWQTTLTLQTLNSLVILLYCRRRTFLPAEWSGGRCDMQQKVESPEIENKTAD